MDVDYHIEDYYDWREEDESYAFYAVFSTILSEDFMDGIFVGLSLPLWQMNITGLARNYTNYDVLKLRVTWTEGQTIDNGATMVFTDI
jgi:hypothetical protein